MMLILILFLLAVLALLLNLYLSLPAEVINTTPHNMDVVASNFHTKASAKKTNVNVFLFRC